MIPGVLLWLGPTGALPFVFGMAIYGGVLTVFLLLLRSAVPAHAAPGFAQQMLERKKEIPYGVAIAAGAFMAAGQSPLLISFIKQISGTN